MKKHLVMALVPFLALGCGDDLKDENGDGIADGVREPDTVTAVTPSTPKGTVSGQVLSTDLKALSEASVELTIGSSKESLATTTDAKGNFTFPNVPAGSQVLLTFTKAGFATLRATATIPSSAGNVPINNANVSFGPVTLTRLDGTLRFVLVSPTGRPAAGVKATLEASPAGTVVLTNSDQTTRVVSTVVVEGTSDEQGVVTFQGVPTAMELARFTGAQYRLWVSAVDANNDGIPESFGASPTYAATTILSQGTTQIIKLPFSQGNSDPLAIESSNVSSIRLVPSTDPQRNLVKPGEPIYVYFNKPVQPGSLLARLTDEYGKESLAVTATLSNGGYSATIAPAAGVVQEGKEYNLQISAVAAENGAVLTKRGFFFGGEQSAPKQVSISDVRFQDTQRSGVGVNALNANEKVYVSFSSPLKAPLTNAYVFLNIDLNSSGGNPGDFPGEEGNAVGLPLFAEEPTAPIQTRTPAEVAVFPIDRSGYTTRYYFIYPGPEFGNLFNFQMRVSFSSLTPRTDEHYLGIWGQPVTTDMSSTTLGVIPMPAL
ncbi:carboxypeptidase-like regulatory domain-containing protein [Myxococcus sp. K15C18031901]|uniref:carboxypeptidase-like regulatory domain-containing protein n=1 Tax=Myxococcus dinghuensis TaxID=2906761 RepID=UPI0020A75F8B|nr:carboxypeptidase-like regulatory domain-containing protein [Myxococcus dinghuensis]MCP3098290.1 carboxypeptidase-like regulatory domain-containing protein [Myxococcus dinghuensis]